MSSVRTLLGFITLRFYFHFKGFGIDPDEVRNQLKYARR